MAVVVAEPFSDFLIDEGKNAVVRIPRLQTFEPDRDSRGAIHVRRANDGTRSVGVHRAGVTEAAGKLQDANIIKYARGHISVLDRRKLERRVCECYALVKSGTGRLSQLRV